MKPSPSLPQSLVRSVAMPLRRRIQVLSWLQWVAFPVVPLLVAWRFPVSVWTLVFTFLCVLLYVAVSVWEASQRRQFFMAHLRSKRQFVAMPSKVIDSAWHEFILHTRAYEEWCRSAFGKTMHHTPAAMFRIAVAVVWLWW